MATQNSKELLIQHAKNASLVLWPLPPQTRESVYSSVTTQFTAHQSTHP